MMLHIILFCINKFAIYSNNVLFTKDSLITGASKPVSLARPLENPTIKNYSWNYLPLDQQNACLHGTIDTLATYII